MACNLQSEMQEPSIDTDKLSYEIFSILESKFLFGYDDQKLWIPKQIETKSENQRGKICILSIDGGGMRGILSGRALAYLEQALKTKSGNPQARIADYFDVAAGGSSGSAASGLEKAMKEAFAENGRSLTLKDTLKPVFDFRLWEVCRATSAEPAIFEPVSMRSVDGQTRCVAIDGGLAMSNPTAAAITHVLHNKQEFPFVRGVEDLLVLSLGTGQLLEGSYDYDQVKNWKAKDWARPMARISGDGAADMVDHSVAMAFGQSRSSNYVRIQANGSTLGRCGANMDTDPSPSNVKMLNGIAEEMLKQKNVESVLFGGKRIGEQSNFEKLDWFAGELVLEHQRRSCRIAPTVAFKQATPKST
ncbi:unnamed protein product, partial [Vitis vinifera]